MVEDGPLQPIASKIDNQMVSYLILENPTVVALQCEGMSVNCGVNSKFDSLPVLFCQGLPDGRASEVHARTGEKRGIEDIALLLDFRIRKLLTPYKVFT